MDKVKLFIWYDTLKFFVYSNECYYMQVKFEIVQILLEQYTNPWQSNKICRKYTNYYMSEMELNKNRDLISKRHSCSFLAPNSTTQKGTN